MQYPGIALIKIGVGLISFLVEILYKNGYRVFFRYGSRICAECRDKIRLVVMVAAYLPVRRIFKGV